MEKVIKCYLKAVVLSDEVKQQNGLKLGAKTPRYDVIGMSGEYLPLEHIKNPKGQIFFYKIPSKEISRKYNRIADYNLQAKDSINFSGLYLLNPNDLTIYGFGNGLQDEMFGKWKPKRNPFYECRNDGYLFIISNDWRCIEILIIENGLNSVVTLCQDLSNGKFADELQKMRNEATPIFDYCRNS